MDDRSEDIDQLIYEKTPGQLSWSEIGDAIADACSLTSPLIVHRPYLGEPTRFVTREMAHMQTAYDTQLASIDFALHHVLANEMPQKRLSGLPNSHTSRVEQEHILNGGRSSSVGKTVKAIVARYGTTEIAVWRWRTFPVLFEIYCAEQMDFDQLAAVTITNDPARQEELWKSIAGAWDMSAETHPTADNEHQARRSP